MRVLHAWHDHGRGQPDRGEPRPLGGVRPPRPGGKPVPLHGLSEHRQGDPGCRRGDASPGRLVPVRGVTEMAQVKDRYVGTEVLRKEDPELITGQGRYTDDITLPGM